MCCRGTLVNIPRKETNVLLLLCTKNVHLTFEGKCYQQLERIAMGSSFCPVIAGIFMVELKKTIVPGLTNSLALWKRYIDDTHCLAKKVCRKHVLFVLKVYHDNIKFTYEDDRNNMISWMIANLKCRIHRSCCFSQRNKSHGMLLPKKP